MHETKGAHTLLLLFCLSLSCQSVKAQEHTREEAYEKLGISWTLNREIQIPMVDATPSEDAKPTPIALSTDIYINESNKAYIRLYIPLKIPQDTKSPLIIYFHGGDFVRFSASTSIFHNFCNDIASQLPAVVASVEYRLAPEHRLPAAYDDTLNAIFWVRDQAQGIGYGRDPWMEYANFSRVFLVGSGAGANIAYNSALRVLDLDIEPLKIKGMFLTQPFFGGVNRTNSEIRLKDDAVLPLYVTDALWELALPRNANRDHEFCNPVRAANYTPSARLKRLSNIYIRGDYGDPLIDRDMDFAKLIVLARVPRYFEFTRGGFHGMEFVNKTAAQLLYDSLKNFVYKGKGIAFSMSPTDELLCPSSK